MNKQKILVLDDEDAIRLLLKKLFERKGFEVIEAASAEEAQEILQKDFIQIMFFDINLPGMNGI